MKKKVLITLLVFATFIILGLVFKEFISASIFDTLAVSQVTTPSVTLDAFPPDLIIDSPVSTTYTTSSIDINYSVSDSGSGVNTVWYNLDGGSNTTLTVNETETLVNGDHTLFIYANDSAGLVNSSEFVNFTVSVADSTPPDLIVDSPVSTTYTTSSIDIKYSVFESESSVNTVWYNLDGGSNTTLTANTTMTVSDGSHTFYIYANNTAGLVNGSESVSFTVSIAAPPTPGPTGQAAGGEGAGGGGKKISFPGFKVTPELIKVKLKQGDTKSETITVENTGETILEFVIDLTDMKKFVTLSDYAFDLLPEQSKKITAAFTASVLTEPDVYAGWIFVKTKDLVKSVITIVEVESREPLFDVKMSIPQEYKNIMAGESVVGDVTIINMGDILPADVNVDYIIKDLNGNVIDMRQETVAAKDLLSITKRMETPKDLKIGDYVFYVKVYYDGSYAMASDLFSIVSLEAKRPSWLAQQLSKISHSMLIIVLIILIILTVLIVLMRKKRRKTVQPSKQKFKEKVVREKNDLKKLADHIRNNLR